MLPSLGTAPFPMETGKGSPQTLLLRIHHKEVLPCGTGSYPFSLELGARSPPGLSVQENAAGENFECCKRMESSLMAIMLSPLWATCCRRKRSRTFQNGPSHFLPPASAQMGHAEGSRTLHVPSQRTSSLSGAPTPGSQSDPAPHLSTPSQAERREA